jgi:hypothetical protein
MTWPAPMKRARDQGVHDDLMGSHLCEDRDYVANQQFNSFRDDALDELNDMPILGGSRLEI